MKTINAFALRGFDSERILQRNFFLNSLGLVHEDTDSNVINLYDARNMAHLGSAEMVKYLAKLQEIKAAVTDYKKLLDVHRNRLDCLSTRYARNFMETAAQMWQEKYRRAQDFQKAYSEATTGICTLLEKITKLEQSGEKAIDLQRRKEFAGRLQDARQKAGLRQSDLANRIKVVTGTIASYEQAISAPQIPMLIRICHALDCSADELLGLK